MPEDPNKGCLEGEHRRGQLGGRVRVGQATANRAAMAIRRVADEGARLGQQRQALAYEVRALQRTLADQRAYAQPTVPGAKAAKFVKPINVDEHLRGGQTHVHQWHQALAPGQYLCRARIAGQAMDGLVERARSNVLKARWLHIGLSITQNSSKMPRCKHQ